MAVTDELFSIQRGIHAAQGCEDNIRIISEVHQWWTRQGHEGIRICHEHERMGWEWLEYVVARRVEERLHDARLAHSRKARQFELLLSCLRDDYNNFGFAPEPSEHGSTEEADRAEDDDVFQNDYNVEPSVEDEASVQNDALEFQDIREAQDHNMDIDPANQHMGVAAVVAFYDIQASGLGQGRRKGRRRLLY
jgi:hypothetical protein